MRSLIFSMFLIFSTVMATAEEWATPEDVLAAARHGNSEAQLEMGILYQYGFNMSDNRASALAWYMLSAQAGNMKAIQLRDKLQQDMPSPDIEQARQLMLTLAPGDPGNPVAADKAPQAAQ